ncbi:Alcohol acetyltransferase [Cytospora paraplurivora]|uniref:Alcohol acetyltransferase n=1 Tax=Cytospora paraplurivora TaxID=2898453 RepID=A0AAN9U2R2_9PEZI
MANKVNDGTKTTVLRKLGINETYQLAMYIIDQYRGTVLSCRYAIPQHLSPAESRTQLEEAVKVAVVDTVMRHPMLQVGMVDATSKTPSWIQLQSLDLTQHINWFHIGEHDDFEQTVQETFRTQLDDRFPDLSIKQPSWKFTIIRQENAPTMEVLLTWNHPQFDAVGAKVFQEDFLEMLNNAENGAYERTGLDGDILRLPQAPPLLPTPIESLRSLPVDLKVLVKAAWEENRPQFLNRDVSYATWCPIRTTPYKTQYRAFDIDESSLSRILALCRQNKTTITGLLNGLALVAFSSHLDGTTAPAFQSSTIIDHRRNLPPAPPGAPWVSSDRAVSNYVTQCLHKYDTEAVARIRSKLPADAREGRDLSAGAQRELWAVSAANRLEIVRKLESGLRNDLVGLFKYVTDWQKTMGDMAKKTRQFAWLVTNIGVLDGGSNSNNNNNNNTTTKTGSGSDDGQGWSMERAQFGLSAEIPFAVIEFSPVSVAGRGMVVGANWAECAVDGEFAERILADMERWLVQLGRQS